MSCRGGTSFYSTVPQHGATPFPALSAHPPAGSIIWGMSEGCPKRTGSLNSCWPVTPSATCMRRRRSSAAWKVSLREGRGAHFHLPLLIMDRRCQASPQHQSSQVRTVQVALTLSNGVGLHCVNPLNLQNNMLAVAISFVPTMAGYVKPSAMQSAILGVATVAHAVTAPGQCAPCTQTDRQTALWHGWLSHLWHCGSGVLRCAGGSVAHVVSCVHSSGSMQLGRLAFGLIQREGSGVMEGVSMNFHSAPGLFCSYLRAEIAMW